MLQAKQLKEGEYLGIDGATPWTTKQQKQFEELRAVLPPWTTVINLSAVGPLPKEKIAYQEIDLKEAMAEIGAELKPTVGGVMGLDKIMHEEMLSPWRLQKRYGFQGHCHELFFVTSPDRVAEFDDMIHQVTGLYNYAVEDIGIYLLPLERGRAFYCFYDIHCSGKKEDEECQKTKKLFEELSETLINEGAFFDRPYGYWAQLMYSRAGQYTEYLKKIKRELDPNNIMNPGKLCF